LLKLIEEPPDKTIFLFVGHNPDRILNTILSRLQVTRFSRLTDEEIAQGLAASDGLTEESARNIAILANGNMSRALELVHVSASDYTNDLYKWLVVCATPRIPDMIDWADKFRALGREEQKAFLYYAIHVFREILLMLNHAASLNRLTGKEMELAGRLGKKLDAERVERILQVFDRYIYYVERNASAKILAMNLSVEIMHAFTRKSLPARQVFFKAADV
jgi:DNA polymerase-3 subunit delta'